MNIKQFVSNKWKWFKQKSYDVSLYLVTRLINLKPLSDFENYCAIVLAVGLFVFAGYINFRLK